MKRRRGKRDHANSDLRDYHASAGGHTFQVKEDGQVDADERQEDATNDHEQRRFQGLIGVRCLADMQQTPASTRALHQQVKTTQNASTSKSRGAFIHKAPISCWDCLRHSDTQGCALRAGHSLAALPLLSLRMSHGMRNHGPCWPASRSYTRVCSSLQPLRPRAQGNPALCHDSNNICPMTSAHASISAMRALQLQLMHRAACGGCDADTSGPLPFSRRAATAGAICTGVTGLRGLCRARPQLRPLTVPHSVKPSRSLDHTLVGTLLRSRGLGSLPVREHILS